jgi:hypothetical protein
MDQTQTARAVAAVMPRVDILLTCGVIAGPLFVVVSYVHALMRPGFDFARHPLSVLTLEDIGWVQILASWSLGRSSSLRPLGFNKSLGVNQAGPGDPG